ncbi:MAG: CoA-disulfide reductase [Lachnospiraceae bacterium]
MSKKTIIIGGVAGGATTAARLRRKDESMEIIMFEKGEYISYANCGLPYFVGDVIKSRDALLLQTPEAMKKKFNIDVRVLSEVTKILPDEKKVIVQNKKTQESYEEAYDYLVIATGSAPIRPNIPGIDAENVFTVWTVPDTDRIKKYISEHNLKSAAIVGGGFIGLEMAENLHELGLKVTLIEMQNQVMAPVDFEMANLLHENMRQNKVDLILGDGVASFTHENDMTKIELTSGHSLRSDLIVLAIGVKPNSELATDAGIARNSRGGIIVNKHFETSAKSVYAVGDVIEVDQYVTKEKTMIPLAGPANKQARILADILTGDTTVSYKGSLGTAVAKVFDLDVASVGLNEKQLAAMGKKKDRDYFTILINQKSHAGYYPGAVPVTLKLIFDEDKTIYGAQIVGQEGVDKRIDTIATTMRLNGTVSDLKDLELAYAPPFSSAKDPVNMLGFVAENVLNGLVSFMEWDEMDEWSKDPFKVNDLIILDITEEMERMVYSIPNSVHIPLGQLRDRIGELDSGKTIVVYCAVGVRSYNAARILIQRGFEHVKVLSGGTSFYKSMHHFDKKKQGYQEKEIMIAHKAESENSGSNIISSKEIRILDCSGLQCPGPIMKVHEAICEMEENEVLQVSATDMGFAADVDSWCRRTGNTLLRVERKNKENIVFIKKGSEDCDINEGTLTALPDGKTIVVFSGDFDKALAAFIIANGAAAMGRKVTLFFTFWGLNILRKSDGPKVKKSLIDSMFGGMMPKGSKKLKLSKMNMSGMGTAMMKKVMNDKNVDSLEELMKKAMDNGVKLIACTMSMDIMGITKEELLDGVEYAGVASYLGDAEESNVNLFI